MFRLAAALLLLPIAACGNLDKRAVMIDPGDSKQDVLAKMGAPEDRQFRQADEAWQYCQTGAGFGYHDHRIVWFHAGRVTGVTSFKSDAPGRSCVLAIKPIRWEDAPNYTVEIRNR